MFVAKITSVWQHGRLSNFEYLMHINAAAGRSFQDLTQYPVFPWIIADYTSTTLDLTNEATFRDLSKPMGALADKRAKQCQDRYQTMDEFYNDGLEGSSPPFFYGTHYSCAGYVLHYLIRLQPYTDMSVALQGGSFDKADRLFLSVENSWTSASTDNLQDVRELIPEFFYLPEFLTNINHVDLGTTQKDEIVTDVALPPWARGCPREFVRIHREALESKYVSEHLHLWIDLIFGYKQRGTEAIACMNVFIHLTYEGEVDVDAITDTVMKNATIAQINNFGQTPSLIFNKPHPKKTVPDVARKTNDLIVIDQVALSWHSYISPPLSVVGATHYNLLAKVSFAPYTFAFTGSMKGIGDLKLLSRERIVCAPIGTKLIPPSCKKIVRVGGSSGGLSFIPLVRSLDSDKEVTLHENLHMKKITCISVSKSGDLIATGSEDTSVRVWQVGQFRSPLYTSGNTVSSRGRTLLHLGTMAGHVGPVKCIDINTVYNLVISGGSDRTVCIWDFRAVRLVRILGKHSGPVLSVSMGQHSGQLCTLTSSQLRVYSINGQMVACADMASPTTPSMSSMR